MTDFLKPSIELYKSRCDSNVGRQCWFWIRIPLRAQDNMLRPGCRAEGELGFFSTVQSNWANCERALKFQHPSGNQSWGFEICTITQSACPDGGPEARKVLASPLVAVGNNHASAPTNCQRVWYIYLVQFTNHTFNHRNKSSKINVPRVLTV